MVLTVLLALYTTIPLGLAAKVFPVETGDTATARRNKAVEYVLTLSEEDMLAIVPEQSGIYYTDCPNCETGAQDRANWEWIPQKPHHIKCKGCDAVYPNNPKYRDNEYIAVEAPRGEHRYHYHERPDGYRIYFRARADYLARDYIAKACRDLAELYWTTKDEKYAHRAATILIRFAEVFPGYAYKFDYPFRQKKFSPYTRDRIEGVPNYRTSRWSTWAYADISRELLQAYDILRFWPGLDEMDGGEAKRKIENDLLGAMVQFVMAFKESYSNMSPRMWSDFIYAGRVLDQPKWIKEALQRSDIFMSSYFLYDGFWREASPSYAGQVLGLMNSVLAAIEGYEPPENVPEEVAAFVRESAKKNNAAIAFLRRAHDSILLPSGGRLTINDTWARTHVRFANSSTKSVLMPGLGLAVLGGGEGRHQIYSWLNYTSGIGHKHKDALSIGLLAFDNELLRDIGYTHTKWRAWSRCMMSHNTVVVNGLDSKFDRDHMRHRIRAFVTNGKGFHLAEAESDAAYPDITRRFRRTYILVGTDSRDAYLIDVFQIMGGRRHDYLLHGSAAQDSNAEVTGVTMEPFRGTLMNPGAKFKYPRAESSDVGRAGGYGFVRNISAGKAERNIVLDLRLSSKPRTGTATHLVCPPDTTIYLGEAPRIRQAERSDHLLPKFQAPFFCARREGKNLNTVFLAVHEPVNGTPKVERISSKLLKDGVLMVVDRGQHGRDYFTMAFEDVISLETKTADGNLQFEGAWGLARVRDGHCVEAHLVGGRLLVLNEARITGVPGWRGRIRKVYCRVSESSRGYFEVAETIDPTRAGATLLVEFTDKTVRAYNLTRMEKIENGMRLHVSENPGFAVTDNGIELLTYPQRIINGRTVRYWLSGVTHKTMK
jgi:hypothetical protein